VPLPVSPVDGYAYSAAEVLFRPHLASSRQPAGGFVPGQELFPTLADVDLGVGRLMLSPYVMFVDSSRKVHLEIFWSGNGNQKSGVCAIYACALRASLLSQV
jgi:hypothetical protein